MQTLPAEVNSNDSKSAFLRFLVSVFAAFILFYFFHARVEVVELIMCAGKMLRGYHRN